MTKTRSELKTVERRWAMISTVLSTNACFSDSWIRASASESIDAVASSNIKSLEEKKVIVMIC